MIVEKNEEIDRKIKNADLIVLESGKALIDEDWKCDEVFSVYDRIYYIKEGNGGNLEGENEHVTMQPGCIYLIPAGYRYRYWCVGKTKKVYFHINIKRNDGYDVFRNFGKIGIIENVEMVEQVWRDYENTNSYSGISIKAELLRTVAMIAEKYGVKIGYEGESEYSQVLSKAVKYIQDNLSIRISRNEIADHCKVSTGKIATCFKDEMGVSVGKYIDDLVFMEAVRKLIYTEDALGVISDDLGFCDQFYFSRRFRELYHISPLQYRQKMQKLR